MTQITTTTQPGDIVVVVPRWIIVAVGLVLLLMGLSMAFLLMFAGLITEGLLFGLTAFVFVPFVVLIYYIMWRFYWYLLLLGLLVQVLCACASLVGVTGLLGQLSPGMRNSRVGAAIIGTHVVNTILAFALAALTVGVLVMFYRMVLGGGGEPRKRGESEYPFKDYPEDDFAFQKPQEPLPLINRVLKKLEAAGNEGDIQGNTIHVYKQGKQVGIVRVVDRPAAISPVIVKDVMNQRDRLGLNTAYLATSGHFTDETQRLAKQWGIKLMMM